MIDIIDVKNTLLIIPIAISSFAFDRIYNRLADNLITGFEIYMELIQGINTWYEIVLVVVILPIHIEIILRKEVFNYLRKKISFTSSTILQSLLFGILAFNLFIGIFAFFLSILFTHLYSWTKSIGPIIILHILHNFLFVLYYKTIEIPSIIVYAYMTIGIIIFIPSLWLIYNENIIKSSNKIDLF